MSIRKNLFIGVIALGLSPLALANGYMPAPAPDSWEPGAYIGLQLGYGMTNWDHAHGDMSISDSDAFAGRVYIGYDFHKNFAIEAGYSQLFNNPEVTVNGIGYTLHDNTYAIDLMGKIKALVVDNFGLYAKAGVAYLNTDSGSSDLGYPYYSNSIDNINVAYGLGAYYEFNKSITMDVSWLRFNGEQDISADGFQPYTDLFTIGIMWKFAS